MKSKRKTILILTSTFPRWPYDVVPSFVYQLALEQAKKHRVLVLAPYSQGSKQYEKQEGIVVYRFTYWLKRKHNLADGGILPNLKNDRMFFLQIPFFITAQLLNALYLVWKEHVDIIHAQWIIPQGFVAWLTKILLGTKYIVTVLGGDMFPFTTRNVVLLWLYKQILNGAAYVTTVNDAFSVELNALTKKKIYYIPNGVNPSIMKPQGSNKTKNILFVGRLVEKKGVQYLLEAVKLLERKLYQKLWIIGDGPDRQILMKKTKTLSLTDKVLFKGGIPYEKLRHFYNRSACIVVPSVDTQSGDREGFPTVYLDAMACGCPIVTTRIPGIENMIDDLKNGLVVEQKNAQALARAIEQILVNSTLRDRLTKNGLERVSKYYSWNVIGQKYDPLISNI